PIYQTELHRSPFDKLAKNIEIIATDILPAIRKYTAKK
ncbi:LLM class flavin-dependent oxidoreductase, partial [Robertmurraya sp. DFI.2.37]|nr:LLM class flavin-dependent oxidoreductase [Robertmurraya sp. DFI.2.37]